MKLKGEFVLRQVMDNIVAIPVGQTALRLNGMIMLNEVSHLIWQSLTNGATLSEITGAVTEAFDVSAQEAEADILEFTEKLRQADLLEE